MASPSYADLTLKQGVALSDADLDPLLKDLSARVASIANVHDIFRSWCMRADALYFTTRFTLGGADLWPDDPSATTAGRSHVSVNTPAVYVDIPAALQAVVPIEQMLAVKDSPEARAAAQSMENIREAWVVADKWNLKRHKATTVKALYGETASFVYYDRSKERVCADVVQHPRNLHLGYTNDDYDEIEWAAYVSRYDPSAVENEFGVSVIPKEVKGTGSVLTGSGDQIIPWVAPMSTALSEMPYPAANFGPARIEVWDFWYLKPAGKRKPGKPAKMSTWNVTIAGNQVVAGPKEYKEYDGVIPFVPLRNTFIPGSPFGRAELHDMEPLIREKMERLTSASQMIAGATSGDYWQLVGPDAPSVVTAAHKPKLNQVVAPGAGNRIEAITPFVAQFQFEQFMVRLDREMGVISGLNELLLGLSPATALSSSKAVNALISQYESRLLMRRALLYEWDRDTWELVVKVYAKYDDHVKTVVAAGGGLLEINDPSLNPKDEMETANRALSLVGGKLWSQARGMGAVGVDDPEQEQNIIREERTDATLFPESVQVMAQLMAALQSLGLQAPPGAEKQAEGQIASGQNDLRTALGAGQLSGGTGQQGSEFQAPPPPESQVPGATPAANAPFAQAQSAVAGDARAQSMIQDGKLKTRILSETKLKGRK